MTVQEIDAELKKMKRGKAGDWSGLVVEMLKCGGEALKMLLAEMFTNILHGSWETPVAWKQSVVIVLHKKGDTKLPDNYRQITLLPIMCKLFSRIICTRLQRTLDGAQSVDQAGVRSVFFLR